MTPPSEIRPRLAAPAQHRFFFHSILTSALLLASGVAAAANTAPTISGTPSATATAGQAYGFTPAARDADGDPPRFSIANKPGWMTFSASTGHLGGKPGTSLVGKTWSNIAIKVSDGNGGTASLAPFSISVKSAGTPVITGTPSNKVAAGTPYSFKPKASDPNGNALSFRIANKPAWATFSTGTGLLSGTPKAANVGWYGGITIYVTDGKTTASLAPFGIKVTSGSTTNSAPKISGTPPTFAKVGQPYAFKPTASDPDGDALSFGISNKPAWMKFDTSNGTVYGTPTSSNVGTYPNIAIRVSDGKTTSSLPAFTITVGTSSTVNVTLRWSQPTTNTDGSKLTNLAGYKIYYGTTSGTYPNVVKVVGASNTSVVLEGLATGRTWYFAMRSYNTSGTLSPFSAEVKAAL